MRDLSHLRCASGPDLEAWLDWLELEGKRELTIYQYGRAVAPLMRAHPGKTLAEFTADDVNAQLRALPKRSRHVTRSIYNGWFTWAHATDRTARNVMTHVARPKQPPRAPSDVFTDAEVAALEALPLPDGPLWTVLFYSGARRGDARRLKRRHVDLGRGRISFLDGKRGKNAVVPVPLQVLTAVADLDLLEALQPDDHLWYRRRYPAGDLRRRGPGPIGDSTFDEWYRHGIDQAGVRYLNPHQTRHTYGHWLKRQQRGGAPLFDLEDRAALMRHESTRTTAHYYPAVDVDELAQKIAQLPDISPSPTLESPDPTRYIPSLDAPPRQ